MYRFRYANVRPPASSKMTPRSRRRFIFLQSPLLEVALAVLLVDSRDNRGVCSLEEGKKL
jgi:hypothetical protein